MGYIFNQKEVDILIVLCMVKLARVTPFVPGFLKLASLIYTPMRNTEYLAYRVKCFKGLRY